MTATTRPPDFDTIEREASERLAAEEGHLEEDLKRAEGAPPEAPEEEPERSPVRLTIAVALPVVAAGVMVGGVFTGIGARFYAVVAGLLGVGLAFVLRRQRKPLVVNLLVALGLFAIGLVMVVPSGIGNIANLRGIVTAAAESGDVLRPPVGLLAGWQAIIGWLMGITGFAAAWVALPLRRPSLALLIPLPVAAIAGISVPDEQQVASGIAVLALFAIGLGILSSATQLGEDDDRPPLSYEVRKIVRALPLLALILGGLVLLARLDVLFPDPVYDPTEEPQKPKTVPLTEVPDRVLFEVESPISGPWRMGVLDVYDGKDWRLPPFAASEVDPVPRSGVVDDELTPGVRATFSVAGLGGTTLPGLPNPVGLVAEGPQLAFDPRAQAIKVAQGQIQAGLRYTVTAAALPTIDDLKAVTTPPGSDFEEFTDIGDPPPAVADLIAQAPKGSQWEEFDYVRSWILDNVTVTGTGTPTSIDAERVQDMIAGSQEGSPFEIVAAQAMLARWIGIPSRIGYGYDGGEEVEGALHVRPRHGASFVEVYFHGYGWLPVIGTPKKAKPTVGDTELQQFDPNVLPSNEIAVQLYLPVLTPEASVLADQVRRVLFIAVPILLAILLLYALWPAVWKSYIRSRRRAAARAAGPRARIALAYAEWRDYATDFGFAFPTETPLMFLDRFVEDDEHTEFAWLVTRALWGDLQHSLTFEQAAAGEELSRALRRRLAATQPATVRAIAFVSRLSLRHPYAPETDLTRRKEEVPHVEPVPA